MPSGFAIVALALGLSVATYAQEAAARPCNATFGPANLGFTLKDVSGKDVSLNAYKGKVLMINFWATWCAPCKIEIPGLKELYARYRRQGLEIVGIDVDEPPSTIQPYLREMQMNYPVLIGQGREDVKESLGPLAGVPTTVVIDRNGAVCQRYVGFVLKSTLEDLVKRLL
jgi:thiol-disulfide isomerase/thioredoxin